jgi:6-phosphogluconolactonase
MDWLLLSGERRANYLRMKGDQMRLRIRTALRVALLAITVSALGAASAAAADSPVIGHVYVNDNSAGTNTIAGYARHADGSLTALPGSPFSAGGAGTGAPIGSQGALQQSSNGRYVLAVDAGSSQVSVLRIKQDGSLELVDVVSSNGAQPVSIAIHEGLVYVANAGKAGTDYTGFRLGRHGRLHPIEGSTVALPDASSPGDVLFDATGTKLAGTRVGTSLIDSFVVGSDGRLTAAPGSPFPAQGAGPFGSEFSPTNTADLYVSNAHGGKNNGTVSAFTVSDNGTLSSIGSSPFADQQTAPCWVEISHDGRFLFTVNTASGTISRYAVTGDGSLRLIGSTALRHFGKPFDARLSPDGSTLFVVDATGQINGFAVHKGDLSELSSSPTSAPGAPFGLVVN